MFGTKGFVKKSCSYPSNDLFISPYILYTFYILGLSWNNVVLKDAFTFYVYSKVSRYLTSTGRPIHYR